VTRALDRADRALAAEFGLGQPPQVFQGRGGVAVVQQVNGNVVLFNADGSVRARTPASFTPNVRQAVVKFRTEDRPADVLREFSGSVIGFVRTGIEPVATTALNGGQRVEVEGAADVTMRTTFGTGEDGRYVLTAELAYDSTAVIPATPTDVLGGRVAGINYSLYGVRVTDADGKPYELSPALWNQSTSRDRAGRVYLRLPAVLHPTEKGQSPPATATFWATYHKPVEVPFVLRDVPAAGK
jgi:hypothetical protein